MSFKKATLILIVIVILLGIAFVLDSFQDERVRSVDSFEECADLYPVMESYPRQCRTPDGRHFVEEIERVPGEGEDGTTTSPGNGRGEVERVPEELFPSDPTVPEGETSRVPGAYDGCVITGCSSQVCADEEVATTCEFHESYACYSRVGVCERRNNICGWRQTEVLGSCVASAS